MQCVRLVRGGVTPGYCALNCGSCWAQLSVKDPGREVAAARVEMERDLEALCLIGVPRRPTNSPEPGNTYDVPRMHSQSATEQPAGLSALNVLEVAGGSLRRFRGRHRS